MEHVGNETVSIKLYSQVLRFYRHYFGKFIGKSYICTRKYNETLCLIEKYISFIFLFQK